MGHIRHHAIIVTSGDGKLLKAAWDEASSLDLHPTSIETSRVNGYGSFLVPPDGSKSGWADSDQGDARMASFVVWLRSKAYDDGSSSLEWCEVMYGHDDKCAVVTQSQWQKETHV